MLDLLWASLSSASLARSASLSFMLVVSMRIRQSGLFALMNPSLNSLRKGNFAFKAAMSLSVMAAGAGIAGSGTVVGPARIDSSCM
jgi:hypothetical protein